MQRSQSANKGLMAVLMFIVGAALLLITVAALSVFYEPGGATAAVRVVSTDYRVVDRNQFGWTYSYQVTVENPGGSGQKYHLRVQLLDREGFEIARDVALNHTIGPASTDTYTDTIWVGSAAAANVASINAVLGRDIED